MTNSREPGFTDRELEQALPQVRMFAARHCGSMADDLVQDAMVLALKHRCQFRADSKLSTWLIRILQNRAADLGRRRIHKIFEPLTAFINPIDHRASDPEKLLLGRERAQLLRSSIANLPASMQHGLREHLAGDGTGLSVTVRAQRFRAIRRLRQKLRWTA